MRSQPMIPSGLLVSLVTMLIATGLGLGSSAETLRMDEAADSPGKPCTCRRFVEETSSSQTTAGHKLALSTHLPQGLLAEANSEQASAGSTTINLEDLDLHYLSQGWSDCKKNKSVDGAPLKLEGKTHEHGIGTHTPSELHIDLKGQARRFESVVGVDDEVGKHGSVIFEVWVDGKKEFDSGVLLGGEEARQISVDLTGAKHLLLVVADGGDNMDFDHADWTDAKIAMAPGTSERPVATTAPDAPAPKLAPTDNSAVGIHAQSAIGTTPGRPFMYLIPATGKGAITYQADGLPSGLNINSQTGVIQGSVEAAGLHPVKLKIHAENGTAEGKIVINAGTGKLALTPPMGWNSWNCWGGEVQAKNITDAADWLVKSGLAAHGYQYINIDDGWEGGRNTTGNILTNQKFPDMKAVIDYIHKQGLKVGIYSSPGPQTCQRLEGSYKHEAQDAESWANWGFDYLKYDLCSYNDMLKETVKNPTADDYKKPYELMHECLSHQKRDIVYSLCQYGLGKVWEWGGEVGGNSWRTTDDIIDNWGVMSRIGFAQGAISSYAGPGRWTDPDMLVVGQIGIGSHDKPKKLHLTRLNHNEQVTHISLWSMLSAPLLIGCDLSQLDSFTIDLLSNDEVIAIDQDPLGKQATCVDKQGPLEVWSKPLADGTQAVGLFNRSPQPTEMKADWSKLGLSGAQPLRDLWQRKDLGEVSDAFTTEVAAHGAKLLKIGKPQP